MVHAYRLGGMLRVDTVQLHHPAGEKIAIWEGGWGRGQRGGQTAGINTDCFAKTGILTVLRAARSMTMTNRSPV